MRKILYLLAGGAAKRFGNDKLMMMFGNELVFTYVLKNIIEFNVFDDIVVVADSKKMKKIKEENITGIYMATAGDIRFASLVSAYYTVKPEVNDIILVHDAARPNIKKDLVEKIIEETEKNGNCFPAIKVTDTLRLYNENETKTIERKDIYQIQTPQGFNGEILRRIIEYNGKEMQDITDEGVILEKLGLKIHLIVGDRLNFKITYLSDYMDMVKIIK